jgi:hypothetical protein
MTMWRCFALSPLLLLLASNDVRFGSLKIEERSVAFVADGSRWTKNKQIELNEELVRAIAAMPADAQFAVMFFADEQVSAFGGGALVAATDENKGKLKDWLDGVRLGDQPTPKPALTRAFGLKPERVVFITDGKFKDYDDVEAHVASLNKDAKVRVHTAGFFSTEDEDDSRSFATFMKRLAERNGGRFAVVYADELKRRNP